MTAVALPSFRNPTFDNFFISVIPAIAVVTAITIHFYPEYFEDVLLADLMLLGYHHVISTYTRLAFAKVSVKEHRFLLLQLPLIVLFSVWLLVYVGLVWAIATIYLHWQWWHYTRQSEGVAKALAMKLGSAEAGEARLNRVVFYSTPIAAILFASSRQPATFLFMDVVMLPVPELMAWCVLAVWGALLIHWLARQSVALKNGQLHVQHFIYLCSHHLVYFVAYIAIKDITIGWLAINIWHNMQYISFVWHFNANRFKSGVEKSYFLISWISQPHRVFIYLGVCFLTTLAFYGTINQAIDFLSPYTALPLVVIAYQTVNFHHYIVDSIIWKMRNPKIRQTLGVEV